SATSASAADSIVHAHCGAPLPQEPRRCSAEAAGAAGHHTTWSRHSIMLPFHMSDQHAGQLFYPDTAHAGGGTAMEMRVFGRTGMQLSVLGFGCGAVGGLMVRGDPVDQERTVARATAAGVNYFDTAVQYGNGESEKNLGRILQRLKPANVVVGTK